MMFRGMTRLRWRQEVFAAATVPAGRPSRLIDAATDSPHAPAVRLRLGGLRLAFTLVGYRPSRYQDLQMEARDRAVTRDEAALSRVRIRAGEDPATLAASALRSA